MTRISHAGEPTPAEHSAGASRQCTSFRTAHHRVSSHVFVRQENAFEFLTPNIVMFRSEGMARIRVNRTGGYEAGVPCSSTAGEAMAVYAVQHLAIRHRNLLSLFNCTLVFLHAQGYPDSPTSSWASQEKQEVRIVRHLSGRLVPFCDSCSQRQRRYSPVIKV